MRLVNLASLMLCSSVVVLTGCPDKTYIPLQSGRMDSPEVANRPLSIRGGLELVADKQIRVETNVGDEGQSLALQDVDVQLGEDELFDSEYLLTGEIAASLFPNFEVGYDGGEHYNNVALKYQFLGDESTNKGVMAAVAYKRGWADGASKDGFEDAFELDYDAKFDDYSAIVGYRFNQKFLAYGSVYRQNYDMDLEFSGGGLVAPIAVDEQGDITGLSVAFEVAQQFDWSESSRLAFTFEITHDNIKWDDSLDESINTFNTKVSIQY
tara:strand:- start:2509 stop:3309 length:801 start_codon:yes stop_codon:yes gene_type:complete